MAGLIGNMWENDSPVEGIRFCHNLKTNLFCGGNLFVEQIPDTGLTDTLGLKND
jgi:hypothetical protein